MTDYEALRLITENGAVYSSNYCSELGAPVTLDQLVAYKNEVNKGLTGYPDDYYVSLGTVINTLKDNCYDPELLVELARKDISRLHARIKTHVPGLSILYGDPSGLPDWRRISDWEGSRGVGPKFFVKKGRESFESSYITAADNLVSAIVRKVEIIKHPGILLQVHYVLDGDCNVFGDYAWHKFEIFSRKETNEFIS
jgi:hypothetical protein